MISCNTTLLDFDKLEGILPVIIQDVATKAVLMLGYMNKEALDKTINHGNVIFWSRSKKRLWEKGETSGNTLEVVSIATDCDGDTLLIQAHPKGPTCHTGAYSCFGADEQKGLHFLQNIYDLIQDRKKKLPQKSYTTSLFIKGLETILGKIEEESGEVIQAATKESRTRLIEESADLVYHLLVLLVQKNISLADLIEELQSRRK